MTVSLASSKSISSSRKKSGGQTIFWWIAWITLNIASFFVASSFWTPLIARHFGSIHQTRTAIYWVAAVFGTWMIILIPLIIVMYQKVDKAYEDARIRRENAANRFRSVSVDRSRRLISPDFSSKLQSIQETISGGHLVTLLLKDGRQIPHVFISDAREILGIYDSSEFNFEAKDIANIEVTDRGVPLNFLASRWLRLDGVSPQP